MQLMRTSHLVFQQPHSQVPVDNKDWPSQATILTFQSAVRERLMNLYDNIDSSKVVLDRKIGRVLFMTLEHEAMHLETLLYMLLHGAGTLSPPVFTAPSWTTLAVCWNETPKPISCTVTLGPALVILGHDDNEANDETPDDARSHEFGWDNETPKRQVLVGEFKIEWRPVTNGEFYQFYIGLGKGNVPLPASWVEEAGAMKVRSSDSHSGHLVTSSIVRHCRSGPCMVPFRWTSHTTGRWLLPTIACPFTLPSKGDDSQRSRSCASSMTSSTRGMKVVPMLGLGTGILSRKLY